MKTEADEFNELSPLTRTNKYELLSWGEAIKSYAGMAVPFGLSRALGVGSDFIGAYMLAKLGLSHLAASGLISVIRNFTISSGVVSIYSTSILQRQAIAKNEPLEVGRILKASYAYAVLLGLGNSLLLYFAEPLLKVLGQEEESARITGEFFKAMIISGGVIATLTSVCSQQTAYAIDKPNFVLGVNIVRRALYLGLAYLFIYGKFGIPELGAAGLAYANAISAWADQLTFILYYRFNSSLSGYNLNRFDFIESFKKHFIELTKKSLSMGIQTFNEYLSQLAGTLWVGRISTVQLAASEIAVQYYALLNIPVLSATQSASLMVRKYASKEPLNARRVGNAAIISTLIAPLIAIPLFASIPRQLTSLFLSGGKVDDEILSVSTNLLRITAVSQLPDVIRNVTSGVLRGSDYYFMPALINVISMTVIGLVVGAILSDVAGLGAEGMYIGFAIGMVISSMVSVPFWLTRNLDEKSEMRLTSVQRDVVSDSESKVNKQTCLPRCSFWSGSSGAIKTDVESQREYGPGMPN